MAVYDDKTPGIIKSGNYSMISSVKSRTEAVFKASYIVASGIQVEGKITALFDLIVIGDVKARDIDVKGKFVCLGNCQVSNTITVQDKVVVKEIKARSIEVHDDITAQGIEVDSLKAEGNIIVGQTLVTEKLAYSTQKILCGETIYGAGDISAYTIITGEELDLDNGDESVVDPNKILFDDSYKGKKVTNILKYAANNDFEAYIGELISGCDSESLQVKKFRRWYKILQKVSDLMKQPVYECYDLGLLLGLTEIRFSGYFGGWETIEKWQNKLILEFNKLAVGGNIERKLSINDVVLGRNLIHSTYGKGHIVDVKKSNSVCATVWFECGEKVNFNMGVALKFFSCVDTPNVEEVTSRLRITTKDLSEWAMYLKILRVYGGMFNSKITSCAMDLLCSKLGVKSKFILDRIKENGWSDNG